MGLIFKNTGMDLKKGLIPIYNKILLIKKYRLPQYNLILIFIPLISLYPSYIIYKKMCEIHKKDNLYVIELTLFPFIFNLFLGLELKFSDVEKPIKQKTEEIEYTWHPKETKNPTVYKVTRNNKLDNLNVKLYKENEIIEDLSKKEEYKKKNRKECINCKSRIPEQAEVCPVCGTKQ